VIALAWPFVALVAIGALSLWVRGLIAAIKLGAAYEDRLFKLEALGAKTVGRVDALNASLGDAARETQAQLAEIKKRVEGMDIRKLTRAG
jgi:hypothetical protein